MFSTQECYKLNVRAYRRGNQKWTIQRKWQHKCAQDEEKITNQKHNTLCVGHHYMQANANNVNKT